jgi:hypothetical protein
MLPLRQILTAACLSCSMALMAQGASVTSKKPLAAGDTAKALDWRSRHQPARAALYSAILPGAGQIYNRKYWKVPIVLGGLGVSYWFIQDNNKEYQRYKDAYLDVVNGRADEFNGRYGADQLRSVADTYHRWRDLSYVAFGLVYALNIVDASVDGYFVRFDVSNDLSIRTGPSPALMAQGVAGINVSMTWHTPRRN